MSTSAKHRQYTLREYVQLERYSNVKHEYADGQIYAMGGGTPEHGTYAANIIGLLMHQLRGRTCRVHTSDVRIRVPATGLDTYPDVSIVCGHAERDADDELALTNPVVLVEVLSPSTEEYDRGEKLEHYKQIAALREVVFVAHDARRIEIVRRESTEWSSHEAGPGASVQLESIGCSLDVDEVYRDALATD